MADQAGTSTAEKAKQATSEAATTAIPAALVGLLVSLGALPGDAAANDVGTAVGQASVVAGLVGAGKGLLWFLTGTPKTEEAVVPGKEDKKAEKGQETIKADLSKLEDSIQKLRDKLTQIEITLDRAVNQLQSEKEARKEGIDRLEKGLDKEIQAREKLENVIDDLRVRITKIEAKA